MSPVRVPTSQQCRTLNDNGLNCRHAGDADKTIYEIDFTLPSAITIGSEGTGIRPLVRRNAA
jgi:tRNA G18 (ribose-2'-O)-methylase SpoU